MFQLTEILSTINPADAIEVVKEGTTWLNHGFTLVASLVGGGGISAIIAALISRRKNKAEARVLEVTGDVKIVDAAMGLVEKMQEDMERMERRIENLEEEKAHQQELIEELRGEIKELQADRDSLRERCKALEEERESLKQQLKKEKK